MNMTTFRIVIDTPWIQMERICVGLDWNFSWSFRKCRFHCFSRASHFFPTRYIHLVFVVFSIITWSILSRVRFVNIRQDWRVVLPVIEGVCWITSFAAIVIVYTIDERLLRKGHKLSVHNLICTLENRHSSESPARATWALILNCIYSTQHPPINWDAGSAFRNA